MPTNPRIERTLDKRERLVSSPLQCGVRPHPLLGMIALYVLERSCQNYICAERD